VGETTNNPDIINLLDQVKPPSEWNPATGLQIDYNLRDHDDAEDREAQLLSNRIYVRTHDDGFDWLQRIEAIIGTVIEHEVEIQTIRSVLNQMIQTQIIHQQTIQALLEQRDIFRVWLQQASEPADL